MTKDEALRIALEALEDLGMKHYENTGEVLYKETFTAIKSALEAKDEPVAQGSIQHLKIMMEESAWEGRIELSDVLANIDEFYTAPPQRKPLTDEEIDGMVEITDLSGAYYYDDLLALARAIEAAHGIKGEA
jgi:hypothetical protein